MAKAEKGAGRKIVVTQRKGGVGKSTITTNLAIHLAERRRQVVILDIDPQHDSLDFVRGRAKNLPDLPKIEAFAPARAPELRDMMNSYAASGWDVICDCPPGDSELVVAAIAEADALLSPFKAGGNDMRSVGRALALAAGREDPNERPRLLAFINEYKARFNNDRALKQILEGSGIFNYAGGLPFLNEVKDAVPRFQAVWEFAPGSAGALAAREICERIERSVS